MRISVVCPVYNTHPDHLIAAAQAILDDASGHVAELLLIDDHSDRIETVLALQALAARDTRVVLLTNSQNEGPSFARNRGIAAATAEWIGFTDADDLWTPEWPASAARLLQITPEADWICGNYALLDRNNGLTSSAAIPDHYPGTALSGGFTRYAGPALTRFMISNYWLHLGACIVRSSLLQSLGGFNPTIVYSEDWLLFARLSVKTALYYSAKPVYILRRQTESLTTSPRSLTVMRASGHLRALQDPLLVEFKRELRWALYGTWKGLAANNVLAGHPARGILFALAALAMDPREIFQFIGFIRLTTKNDPRCDQFRLYTHAKLISHTESMKP